MTIINITELHIGTEYLIQNRTESIINEIDQKAY